MVVPFSTRGSWSLVEPNRCLCHLMSRESCSGAVGADPSQWERNRTMMSHYCRSLHDNILLKEPQGKGSIILDERQMKRNTERAGFDDALLHGTTTMGLGSCERKRRPRRKLWFNDSLTMFIMMSAMLQAVLGRGPKGATAAPTAEPAATPTVSSPMPTRSLEPTPPPAPPPTDDPFMSPGPTTKSPTLAPTLPPTLPPTERPSHSPTSEPSSTYAPSHHPTATYRPSDQPTESPAPSPVPTPVPTTSSRPSMTPSVFPTDEPSQRPSDLPTMFPTFENAILDRAYFQQRFTVGEARLFSSTEVVSFQQVMESYTLQLASQQGDLTFLINTTCSVLDQQLQTIPIPVVIPTEGPSTAVVEDGEGAVRRLSTLDVVLSWFSSSKSKSATSDARAKRKERRVMDVRNRALQSSRNFVQVEYSMTYQSESENVTNYALFFQSFVNLNVDLVTADLQENGLNVTDSDFAVQLFRTEPPSGAPTSSLNPTAGPSSMPTTRPTIFPTQTPSILPSTVPSNPSGGFNSVTPTPSPGEASTGAAVGGAVAGVLVVTMIGAFFFWRRRRRIKEAKFQAETSLRTNGGAFPMAPGHFGSPKSDDNIGGAVSPDSLMSKRSLLSAGGHSIEGFSDNEDDDRHHLADEFDQYKDQNLERMRSDIEGNLTNFDGMMSRAMTKAFMDDDESNTDRSELYWGCSGDDVLEIEASALCDVYLWLRKRNFSASVEERRGFMQEMLNRMVASVRHGVIGPEKGSQTIHECAALLNLELAVEIPETILIVSGMRKTVSRDDMLYAFHEFGEILYVSLASNSRGFGVVRYVSPKSVRKAMSRDEVVVQDVAVQLAVLRSDSRPKGNPSLQAAGAPVRESSRTNSPRQDDQTNG